MTLKKSFYQPFLGSSDGYEIYPGTKHVMGVSGGGDADLPKKILILISGKRCSGKDYFTNKFLSKIKSDGHEGMRVAFADGCKEGYALASGADAQRLMQDRDYKELHRDEMTKWYHETADKNPALFREIVKNKIIHAKTEKPEKTLFILASDLRL